MIELVIGSHVAELMDVIKREEAKRVASGGGHLRPTSDELGLRVCITRVARNGRARQRSASPFFWHKRNMARERPMADLEALLRYSRLQRQKVIDYTATYKG